MPSFSKYNASSLFGFDAMQILNLFNNLEQGATELLRETLHYIKTKNLAATFTNKKMLLIKLILTFVSKRLPLKVTNLSKKRLPD